MPPIDLPLDTGENRVAKPVILFDYFGVMDIPSGQDIWQELGVSAEKGLAFMQTRSERLDIGQISSEQLWTEFFEEFRVEIASCRPGIHDGEALKSHVENWEEFRLNPKMLNLVRDLKQDGYLIAIASNASLDISNKVRRAGGYDLFGKNVVLSCDLGKRKPSKEFFDAAAKYLGIEISNAILIDDSENNVLGARRAGLKAIQFTSHGDLVNQLRDLNVSVQTATPSLGL